MFCRAGPCNKAPGGILRGIPALAVIAVVLFAGGCGWGSDGASAALLAPGLTPTAPQPTPLGRAGCIPNCRGKSCGSDGCAGTCGSCKKSLMCVRSRCVKNSAPALCRQVAGRWKGLMRTRPYHYLDGRIYLWGKKCRGQFKVSYRLRSGPAWVMQDFVIRVVKRRMYMRGVRISGKSHNSNYNLDRFAGQLDKSFRRFTGKNRDVRGSVSAFYLNKK